MVTRKNVRNLTATEKANFIKAVKGLKSKAYKSDTNPATNYYDAYVLMHAQASQYATLSPGETGGASYRSAAHRGPAFHPWHRVMLYKFELDLQTIVPGIAIPYWDWTQDTASPSSSPIWASDFMGGNGAGSKGYAVQTGPFSQQSGWTIVDANGNNAGPLKRQFANSVPFPSSAGMTTALVENPFDKIRWDAASNPSHRNRLEGWLGTPLHNNVHSWVGQTMRQVLISPNDPVFYLHHCNVDRLWSLWQAQNPSQGYQPASGGPPGHNLNDQMYPWGIPPTKPADVLLIANLGYNYA